MKCPYCGQEHADSFLFCPQTGKRAHSLSATPYSRDTHEAIDLGISVKWATCNIGAQKPEDFGCYFAWGETMVKNEFFEYNYRYGNEHYYRDTKYTMAENDPRKRKTILEPVDDVAQVMWGMDWRMPTESEFIELINDCACEWTVQNEVNGLLVRSKRNKNSIFLPAAGLYYQNMFGYGGETGAYWSSSLFPFYDDCAAFYLSFEKGFTCMGNKARYQGISVRPVCK